MKYFFGSLFVLAQPFSEKIEMLFIGKSKHIFEIKMLYQVHFSYHVPCTFHHCDSRCKPIKKPIKLTSDLLESLYRCIRKYRTTCTWCYGQEHLGENEISDQFISSDYGLVKILCETMTFTFVEKAEGKGILQVECDVSISTEGETDFTLEKIEELIFDANNMTYSSEIGSVMVVHDDIYFHDEIYLLFEVTDTPRDIDYHVDVVSSSSSSTSSSS